MSATMETNTMSLLAATSTATSQFAGFYFGYGDNPNIYVDRTTTPATFHNPKLKYFCDAINGWWYSLPTPPTTPQIWAGNHAFIPQNMTPPDTSLAPNYPKITVMTTLMQGGYEMGFWAWRDLLFEDGYFYGATIGMNTSLSIYPTLRDWFLANIEGDMRFIANVTPAWQQAIEDEKEGWELGNGRTLFGIANPIM